MSQANYYPPALLLPEAGQRAGKSWTAGLNNIHAIGGIVIKELYRRKDFYVLFILTALLTLVLGSVNFFNEDKVVRCVKEFCLDLIWLSALVMAITTAA